ncbi:MAG TPA: hypothetical protein VJ785_17570 [Anaerolineales bacterium]|nr:hypothetical protein [Anaerolineales bacterium]
MKRNVLTLGMLLILLTSACAPEATATADPLDVQHTAEAAAFTVVAETQAANPTNTPIPPTATESPTPTSIPLPTGDPALGTATGLPTIAPTSASQQSSGSSQDDCNKPLTGWDGPTANFVIANETRPEGKLVLSLYVVTPRGECGYLTDLSSGPLGMYSAGAFVDGDKDFKVFGGFQIQEGNWKIVVRNDKILALGGCYPNC